MALDDQKVRDLVALVEKMYPGWSSFSDRRFIKDEIEYKQKAASLAQELLGQGEFKRLLDLKDYEEIRTRLEKIGRSTNLLFQGVPLAGDLNVLYQEGLEKESFSLAIFELIHGGGETPERLDRYASYLIENNLPNKWTFPTYLLFLFHPNSEIFVKPMAARWFLQIVEVDQKLGTTPKGKTYAMITGIALDLKHRLSEYMPRDMVDIQSLIWVASSVARESLLSKEKSKEFENLYMECIETYPSTREGQRHVAYYAEGRLKADRNYQEITGARNRGEDITDLVLVKLLPHSDTAPNRERGAWIHVAPSITKDVRSWFEGSGWTKAEDWPRVAEAIFQLIDRCVANPEDLEAAIDDFLGLQYSKGFQTGMLTPILSALRPDEFVLINSKSLKVINYLTGRDFHSSLRDYPKVNSTALSLIEELSAILSTSKAPDLLPVDLFDMFSHWMVAVKQFSFTGVCYWKIAPGEDAWNWAACRDGGFIAIGWDELGDVSKMNRSEFSKRRDELVNLHDDWTKSGADQVWKFANIDMGDIIVANRGTTELLGIGIVTGPYEFVPGVRHGHRLPVEWQDLTRRQVDEGEWRRTLIEIDERKLKAILESPAILSELPKPLSEIFENQEQADQAFNLMAEAAKRLGIEGPNDPMASFTLRRFRGNHAIHFSYGRWLILGFAGSGGELSELRIALFTGAVDIEPLEQGTFAQGEGDPSITLYTFRAQDLFPLDDNTLDLFYATLDHARQEFEGWSGSPYHKYTVDEIAAAVFSHDARERLFSKGLSRIGKEVIRKGEESLGEDVEGLELQQEYSLGKCSEETGLDEELFESWVRAIHRKGQAILYGPPGTGKTYIAEKLAKHLIGGSDGVMELVQFHPAYAYEDFIQGIRPQSGEDGGLQYPIVPGRFLEFCEEAGARSGLCVLIIDEINRANLARVLGELMYLLEYRDAEIPLASGVNFKIPSNVRIIGTMNTADRSIALVDHALRRRFAFLALYPKYEILRHYHKRKSTGYDVEPLIQILERLNRQINDPNYSVGFTYFLRKDVQDQLQDIWRMEIEPYLEEYFFDQQEKVENFRWEKISHQVIAGGQ